uniref:Uncharacterized protein n=1 Tax=Oryza punctata TaxID=4537 RepID=A0A0E0JW71_ORYPU
MVGSLGTPEDDGDGGSAGSAWMMHGHSAASGSMAMAASSVAGTRTHTLSSLEGEPKAVEGTKGIFSQGFLLLLFPFPSRLLLGGLCCCGGGGGRRGWGCKLGLISFLLRSDNQGISCIRMNCLPQLK